MGRVSRDARLTFILMWTLADDSGRLRGSSRMLASLLYPYDNDAPGLIHLWIGELRSAECIDCYEVGGQSYIQIRNWLIHQKIDRPSQSKFPGLDESSRILANPREPSSLDQGPRIKDQGGEAAAPPVDKSIPVDKSEHPPKPRATRIPKDWALSQNLLAWTMESRPKWTPADIERVVASFKDYWAAKAGKDGTKLDWDATWRVWLRREPESFERAVRKGVASMSDAELLQKATELGVSTKGLNRVQLIDKIRERT